MNTRKNFLMQGGMAVTALLAAKPFKTFARYSSPFSFLNNSNNITLLHTCGLYAGSADSTVAFHQTVSMIAALRKENNSTLLFNTGNSFYGENDNILQIVKSLDYDAVLPGNPDVEGTQDMLKNLFDKNIPVIASNYDIACTGLKTKMLPYKIINKGNMRIGIIGVGSQSNSTFIYKEPVKEINALAKSLKEGQHCDLVICLSNLGYKNKNTVDDITLAFESKNVDVIIGSQPITGKIQQPSVILNKSGQEVFVNNAGHSNSTLGRVEIGFDEQKRKNRISFNKIRMATDKS